MYGSVGMCGSKKGNLYLISSSRELHGVEGVAHARAWLCAQGSSYSSLHSWCGVCHQYYLFLITKVHMGHKLSIVPNQISNVAGFIDSEEDL